MTRALDAAAQHDLLAEQIGFGLFGERGFDHAGPRAADPLGVGQADALRDSLAGARIQGDQAGDAAAPFEFAAHQVAGPLGGDQHDVDPRRRFDLAEVDVEAVRTHQHVAGRQDSGGSDCDRCRPALRRAAAC